MGNQKGFTLVELLIAATIIGILAVFATTQYRNSAAETRWTGAKARADQLAIAVHRALEEHPSVTFSPDPVTNPAKTDSCNMSGVSVHPKNLISCGYLDRGPWDFNSNGYFNYYVCPGSGRCDNDAPSASYTSYGERGSSSTVTGTFLSKVEVDSNAKLPDSYDTYRYYSGVNVNEEFK